MIYWKPTGGNACLVSYLETLRKRKFLPYDYYIQNKLSKSIAIIIYIVTFLQLVKHQTIKEKFNNLLIGAVELNESKHSLLFRIDYTMPALLCCRINS